MEISSVAWITISITAHEAGMGELTNSIHMELLGSLPPRRTCGEVK